ncbi:casein kinase I isoform delta [Gracilaria domingensis]|nr:casein kinase I isoform delta [Gracilaria domingensis]
MIEFGGTLSLKSVLMIGIQMLRILEDIHARGFIHRDIKPDNILTGLSATDCSSLFLCDFGIAKYIPFHTQDESNAACVYGTVEFASRRALESKEQGKCDDLESLGYTLVYLRYGSLPWQGISFPPDGKCNAAVREIYYDYLWKDLPPEMKMYFEYVKSLDVREKPDYEYLRSLLTASLTSGGMQNDGEFEWSPPARYLTYSDEEVAVDPYRPAALNKQNSEQKHEPKEVSEVMRCNGTVSEGKEAQISEGNLHDANNEAQTPSLTALQATCGKADLEAVPKSSPVSRNTQACRDSRESSSGGFSGWVEVGRPSWDDRLLHPPPAARNESHHTPCGVG